MTKYEIKNIVHPLYRFTVNYGDDVLMYFKDHGVAEDYCALMNFAHHTLRNQGGPSTVVGDKRLDRFVNKKISVCYECGNKIQLHCFTATKDGILCSNCFNKMAWSKAEDPKNNINQEPRGGFF